MWVLGSNRSPSLYRKCLDLINHFVSLISETGSHYVAQASLELEILLLQTGSEIKGVYHHHAWLVLFLKITYFTYMGTLSVFGRGQQISL